MPLLLRPLAASALVALAGCSATQGALDAPSAGDIVSAPVSLSFADGGEPAAALLPVGLVIDEPSAIEDPVQFRAPRAPVRVALLQTRRRVELLPGVGERDARWAATTESAPLVVAASVGEPASRVNYSRAVVVLGAGGEREVRYVESRPGTLDLGTVVVGCEGEPVGSSALQLRGLRQTALRRGMRGDAVLAGQHLLCAAGHAVSATGVFDPATERAVRAFQQAHNAAGRGERLSVDGALGAKTRQALDAAIAASAPR